MLLRPASLLPSLPLRLSRASSTHTFPYSITTNHAISPFAPIQSGPTRTLLPSFSDPIVEQQYRKERLALIFRILHRKGLAEGIAGHCSTIDPVDRSTFWVNPQGYSFAHMKQSTLVQCRVEDGEVLYPEGKASETPPVDASATSIHSQIYRATREKGSELEGIVHVHGPYSKAFSAMGRELDMISQDACAYHKSQALVPFGGAVFDNAEGTRIASYLSTSTKVAILQNHGVLSVGKTGIEEAAWWQINFEMCAHSQLLADAALRPSESFQFAGAHEISETKKEVGAPEMAWFSMRALVEEEERWSGGEHRL